MLPLIARGLSNREIAQDLVVAEQNVNGHRDNLRSAGRRPGEAARNGWWRR